MGEVVEMDGSGRIYLPAKIRRTLSARKFIVRLEGERIILIPLKPLIEKYYGIASPPAYKNAEEIDQAVKYETEKILRKDLH